jgi:hypothetical protein
VTGVRAAAAAYAVLTCAAVSAPALVLRSAGLRGGLAQAHSSDLLAVSAAVGAVAAVLAWRRTCADGIPASRVADRWIAALAALAVLTVAATTLPTIMLYTATKLPTVISTAPWLGPTVWGGCLLASVLTAAAVHRGLLRWLASELPPVRSAPRHPPSTENDRFAGEPGGWRPRLAP